MKNERVTDRIRAEITQYMPCSDDTGEIHPGTVPHGQTLCDYTRKTHRLGLLTQAYAVHQDFPRETTTMPRSCMECLKIFSEGMLQGRLEKILHPPQKTAHT